jgi:hypothetical protein
LKIIALLQVRFLTRSPGIPYQIKFLAAWVWNKNARQLGF